MTWIWPDNIFLVGVSYIGLGLEVTFSVGVVYRLGVKGHILGRCVVHRVGVRGHILGRCVMHAVIRMHRKQIRCVET